MNDPHNIILVSRHHEWRYFGDGFFWGEGKGWDALKRRGYTGRVCMDCGREDAPPFTQSAPCRRKGEHPSSGYSGVLIDRFTGQIIGRISKIRKR